MLPAIIYDLAFNSQKSYAFAPAFDEYGNSEEPAGQLL